jgi:hypothetical protein
VKDASGSTVATGTIFNGVASVAIPVGTSYPITVSVSGIYRNEATGSTEASTAVIRSVIPDAATAAQGIAVTPLTEVAAAVLDKRVADGESLNAALAKSVISVVASGVLNITYTEAMRPPSVDATTGLTQDPLTLKLAALALSVDSDGSGVNLADKLKNVATRIANGAAPSTVLSHYSASLTDVSSKNGAHSQLLNRCDVCLVSVSTVTMATYPLVETQPITASTLKWDITGVWDTAQWR